MSGRLEGAACYGSANTKIEFVFCGMRASGMLSVTMLLAHAEVPPRERLAIERCALRRISLR